MDHGAKLRRMMVAVKGMAGYSAGYSAPGSPTCDDLSSFFVSTQAYVFAL